MIKYIISLLLAIAVVLVLKKNKNNTEKLVLKYDMDFLLKKIDVSDRTLFKIILLQVCKIIGFKPIDILSVLFSESGLQPNIVNANGNATGILQWMPETAISLNTTVEKLKRMTASQQLIYVKKYFYPFRNKLKTPFDIYLATFFPAAIGQPDSFVFKSKKISRSAVARANKTMDLNRDNKITLGEFKEWFKDRIYK